MTTSNCLSEAERRAPIQGILKYVGETPFCRLKSRLECSEIFVKLESFNAGNSIKTRVARQMVLQAWRQGVIRQGSTVIEPTGGNTGVGIALAAATLGFHFIAVVPDNYSQVRIELLKALGAQVELSHSSSGNDSHIVLAHEMLARNPDYVYLDQFSNPACIDSHYSGTAVEILRKCTPDAFVCSVGSGATFTGVGRRLRLANPDIHLQIVQPKGCDIINGRAIQHRVEGTALGIRPPLLDYDLISSVHDVEWEEIVKELRLLARTEGLFLGPSSGANIVGAKVLAAKLGPGKTVCTVAPDGGAYYAGIF